MKVAQQPRCGVDRLQPAHDYTAAAVDERGFLEKLPKWVIVLPLLLQWVVLSLRYGATVLPSAANPTITSGGLVGEGKTEYFAAMGSHAKAATARTGSILVNHETAVADAAACMERTGLAFPIVAKPDVGWCGFGVRLIDSQAELARYLAVFPAGERLLLQAYVPEEGEAGIFYVRDPGAGEGWLLGVALRYFPQVIGDGQSSIGELIARDSRLKRLTQDPLHQFDQDPSRIPERGRRVRLATIGSTRVGGLYRDGSALITSQLAAAIDAIALDMQEFHFGRFDVRYESEEALMRGEGFTIIEVNGAGSEAIEAWDPGLSASAAFGKIFRKQALLYRIAAANRRRGFRTIGLIRLARLHCRQQRLIRLYPQSN
jgi:hypothetical protein